jgi:hypothetical protein
MRLARIAGQRPAAERVRNQAALRLTAAYAFKHFAIGSNF